MPSPRKVAAVFTEAARRFARDKAAVFAAAVAYYALFSLAPLLVIAVAVAGFFLGPDAAQGEIAKRLAHVVGADAAATLERLLKRAADPAGGLAASLIGALTLSWGATRLFSHLQGAFDAIWGVAEKKDQSWLAEFKRFFKKRALSFAMVVTAGIVLVASLAASAVLSAAGGLLAEHAPLAAKLPWLRLSDLAASFLLTVGLLAPIYKYLPEKKLKWADVLLGATAAALLLLAGRWLIGMYLGVSGIGSVFGAAGSLVVLLVWVHFSALFVLYGAEVTRVWAERHGSRRSKKSDG